MLTFYYTDKTAYVSDMVMEEIENLEIRNLMVLADIR